MSIEKFTEKLIAAALNRGPRKEGPTPTEPGLGWEVASKRPFNIPAERRLRHTYILGATGCGKSNLVFQLLEDDVAHGVTSVVLDLRGDLVDRVLRIAADEMSPERVHLIDLRRPQISAGINPFLIGEDSYGPALLMQHIMRAAAESWGVQLDDTLRCSLLALNAARRSVAELPRFLTDQAFRTSVTAALRDEQCQAFFARFDALSPDRQSTWVLPVLNKVSPFLAHPAIRTVLSERKPLDLPAILDQPDALILVALGVDRLHGLAGTFGSLMVSTIESAVMQRVDEPERSRNPVNLYLDEFENFQSPSFEAIIAEGRRFGLGLTLSHQNLGQVDGKLRNLITNNAATRIYFRTGHVDAKALGGELASFGVKNAPARLLHLPVGEAFVIDGSPHARHIRFREAEEGNHSAEALQALLGALGTGSEPTPAVHVQSEKVKHVRTPRAAKGKGKLHED